MSAIETRRRAAEVLRDLESRGSAANVAGMARYGIQAVRALGVCAPVLRATAKALGRDHALAEALWQTGVHEARAVACLVDDPVRVTRRQMERWARDFDSWAVCDAACSILFDKTPFAVMKAMEWSGCREEYVKRAGFVLMAALAVHDKQAPDALFLGFLPVIEREATDGRNFVRKAVNWALRQIGKRNPVLSQAAVATARVILLIDSPAARWVANDALRELENLPENRYKK